MHEHRRQKVDRVAYGAASIALITLAVLFREELGALVVPVFGVILLLIMYELRTPVVRIERLALFMVMFLLFVTWGLFTLDSRVARLLDFQERELSPAIGEMRQWSQSRRLLQPARVQVQLVQWNGSVSIPEALEWRSVTGPSMQPAIFPGHTVLLRPYAEGMGLREGHIIRFVRDGQAEVHRIVAVYDDEVVTQGDNALERETITRDMVTNVAVGVLFT